MAPIVRLEPMDASNIDALKALRVREDQRPYIDPPDLAEFIDDAPHHPTFTVHAIRDDSGVVVGLVSLGFETGNAAAARVYARLSFVPTGEPDERGDATAWLSIG